MAFQHLRQRVASDVDVSHHVHVPQALPIIVDSFRSAGGRDSRVRAEKVDAPVLRLDAPDQAFDIGLSAYVTARRGAPDFGGDALSPVRIQVGHDHRGRTRGCETPREGAANAARGAGDDDDLAGYLHAAGACGTRHAATTMAASTAITTANQAAGGSKPTSPAKAAHPNKAAAEAPPKTRKRPRGRRPRSATRAQAPMPTPATMTIR